MGRFLLAVVIAVLATMAVNHLANRLTVGGRSRYAAAREKLAAWRADQAKQPAPAPSPLAIKVGEAIGGTAEGAVLAWRAGWPGMKLGWTRGRSRVRDWWDRRHPLPDDETDGTDAAGRPEPAPERPALVPPDPPPTTAPTPSGKPKLRVVPPPQGGDVSVIATTGSEISTVADLRAEAQAIVAQYTAELDDAQAEAARKKANLDRAIHLSEVAPGILDRDPAGAGAVGGLVEPARAAYETAQARASNADLMLGQARSALAALEAHKPMEEAKAATPQASTDTRAYEPR